jgi:hypothetical protein
MRGRREVSTLYSRRQLLADAAIAASRVAVRRRAVLMSPKEASTSMAPALRLPGRCTIMERRSSTSDA